MAGRTDLEQTRRPGGRPVRGLVSEPSSDARVRTRMIAPPRPIGDVVERFWAGGWRFPDGESHTTELLADPSVNIVFEDGDGQAGARVVGVWTRLWRRTLAGRGAVRAARLRAGALPALTDVAADRLTNRIVPLEAVFDVDGAALARAVLDPTDDDAGVAVLAAWLESLRAERGLADTPVAIDLVRRVTSEPAITSVGALARATGLGQRVLQRLFREQVGASPKWVIRRTRLQEVADRIERGEATDLARLATELGYADQAHLTRDFRDAVGVSPGRLRARVRARAAPDGPARR